MTKSTIDRLTSLGDQVIGKASEKASQNPTANRVLQSAMQMKERVDDLSKRVRGLEATEKQIAELEKRVAKLEGAAKRAAKSSTPEKPATAE
jgi:polyhydroxyalkanoate synthesis regulator phasin